MQFNIRVFVRFRPDGEEIPNTSDPVYQRAQLERRAEERREAKEKAEAQKKAREELSRKRMEISTGQRSRFSDEKSGSESPSPSKPKRPTSSAKPKQASVKE